MHRNHTSGPPADTFDCAVVGAGVTGLTAALKLAHALDAGRCALIAPRPQPGTEGPADLRTAAVFHASADQLRGVGAWNKLSERAEPLRGIRIVDVTGRLLRAPQVLFRASDIDLDCFGHNIANSEMVRSLEAVAATTSGLVRIDAKVATAKVGSDTVDLHLSGGSVVKAKSVIASDGRNSLLRRVASINSQTWDYEQSAITTRFAHERPHHGISVEMHGPHGPCTTVPMPDNHSSLVWMDATDRVEARLADSTAKRAGPTFVDELSERVASYLGPIADIAPPIAVPLTSLRASRFAAKRIFLVGEAAHAFPPLGAQGLNLGMRDVADVVELIADAIAAAADPGGDTITDAYHRRRRADISARSIGVDLLNQSLISPFPLFPLARGAGMHLLHAMPPLRRAVMRQGMTGL